MLVSLGRRRGLGDDLEDSLAGPDSNALQSAPPQLVDFQLRQPTWASSSTSAAPVAAAGSNNPSSWSWGDLAKNLVQGVVQGVTRPTAIAQPSMLSSSTGGVSTGVIVAGVAALALVGFLVLRNHGGEGS